MQHPWKFRVINDGHLLDSHGSIGRSQTFGLPNDAVNWRLTLSPLPHHVALSV
jgi:hypothetical protein